MAQFGQDLVNHCINDIAVLGARPLFFLDYIAAGKLEPAVFKQLLGGLAKACKAARCALIGGETAQMPGMYREDEYDLAGTIVGVVDRPKCLMARWSGPATFSSACFRTDCIPTAFLWPGGSSSRI